MHPSKIIGKTHQTCEGGKAVADNMLKLNSYIYMYVFSSFNTMKDDYVI